MLVNSSCPGNRPKARGHLREGRIFPGSVLKHGRFVYVRMFCPNTGMWRFPSQLFRTIGSFMPHWAVMWSMGLLEIQPCH